MTTFTSSILKSVFKDLLISFFLRLLRKAVWRFVKKRKPDLLYNLAVLLQGRSLSNVSQGMTCTPTFIAALFIIAKFWKQPKCPMTDECIKKMWYIYPMEYYSTIKKNEIMLLASNWGNSW
jgi:hypothetical protein